MLFPLPSALRNAHGIRDCDDAELDGEPAACGGELDGMPCEEDAPAPHDDDDEADAEGPAAADGELEIVHGVELDGSLPMYDAGGCGREL